MAERLTLPQATLLFLGELRKAGVKSASLNETLNVLQVEFFEPEPVRVERIDPLDVETLVPPPPADEEHSRDQRVPPALARLLKNGSIS